MNLDLRGISVGYGDTEVLHRLDLHVGSGEVVALLGPNGAGKTTLLRAASGLLPLREGDLLVDDVVATGHRPHQVAKAGVCHVAEGRCIFDALTVRDNLRLFAEKGGEAEGIDRAVSAFPKLGSRLHQIAGTMSGGEQQMLALSRAYVQRADVILVDEISLGLAPIVVDQIFGFLAQLASEGRSLLLVEQYVTRALAIADRAYILSRGAIVFEGPASSLDREATFDRYVGLAASAD